jgi:hypothetical protein
MWRVIIIINALSIFAFGECASSQIVLLAQDFNLRPTVGGVGLPPPSIASTIGGEGRDIRKHLNPIGKPCLVVGGEAKPQTINTNIFEHVIVANNSCSQVIKLQVCYYKSDHCAPMMVPAYSRSHVVLGIMPTMRDFRYEYRETFQ